jgi:hypothetical protein
MRSNLKADINPQKTALKEIQIWLGSVISSKELLAKLN